jgi:hypothetical protein
MPKPGDAVRINTPENPRIHNTRAVVHGMTSVGWFEGGEMTKHAVYLLDAPAAATGQFRALRHELIPEYPDADCVIPADEPDKPLAERSGVAYKAHVATGDLCPTCGGLLVQTGTCKTCNSCGNNTGGCG